MSKIEYIAVLTQSGNNDPIVNVLQDQHFPQTSWRRIGPGTYSFKKNTRFCISQPYQKSETSNVFENNTKITFIYESPSELILKTYAAGNHDVPVDGVLNEFRFCFVTPP